MEKDTVAFIILTIVHKGFQQKNKKFLHPRALKDTNQFSVFSLKKIFETQNFF